MSDEGPRPVERADLVVIGGAPAGAALAARVAAAGRAVLIVERQPAWRWRACGVFSSPVTLRELRRLGIGATDLGTVARPIPRLWVESPGGARFALTYGWRRDGNPSAVGFDRSRLDPLLLDLAMRAGASVRRGTSFLGMARDGRGWRVRVRDSGGERALWTRIVVGADGVGSGVARAMGVARGPLFERVGLTFHVDEPGRRAGTATDGDDGSARNAAMDGRMAVFRGGYCGLAPVSGGRINVGLVLAGADLRTTLASEGARATAAALLRTVAPAISPEPLDAIAGVSPIGHRVTRRAGQGWLLVGDAAGFLDPFTGEGLHRALVSARLGADAVVAALAGRAGAHADYDAAMTRRFRAKDLVSLVVQAFARDHLLFDYAAARLERRPLHRERLGRLMGDLVPAAAAFDPRFLFGLLRP